MKPFIHHDARTVREAATLLEKYEGKAKLNAGGTDLLGILKGKCGAEYPEAVINIKTIQGLDYIKKRKRHLKIGALVKLSDLARSSEVKQGYSLISEAAQSIAGPNLRNTATVGGNLAQDVRCWYYRYPKHIGGPIVCMRKGGKICNALVGDNRYHSIFGAAPAPERRCASHCPAHINIPAYLREIRKSNLAEAARILMLYNPIPAITGRVCPIFCEPVCNRSEFDDAVAVRSVERGVGDFILDHTEDYFIVPMAESGKRVAIVGSGPAGLAAAYYLRKSGHRVTVYDRMPEAGGMLIYSIPPYRLPKDVVRRHIQALKDMGIRFEVGVEVGSKLTIADLKSEFDALFLAGGTWRSLKLNVPGEDAAGVHYALDYLSRINSGEKVPLGNRIIVIGGGSVAIDAARTARRLGIQEVHIVCLETRDLSSQDRMPALNSEILEAEEEGIVIHPSLGVREISIEDGKATGLETIKCTSVYEADGGFNPQYDATAPAEKLAGDSIVIAIGQSADASLFESEPISGSAWSDAGMEGVFVGGDMTTGPSTVIQAVDSAQKAVREIEAFLRGSSQPAESIKTGPEYSESIFENVPRTRAQALAPDERLKGVDVEDVAGLSLDEIETEARRCMSCGCLAVGPSDLAIALVTLGASIVTNKRTLPAQAFFAASAEATTVLRDDEVIKEIRVPKPPEGARQRYLKFTLRKPLDFALVSVASVITAKDGICSDARITLGAVAPAPMQARAAEASIKGKPIDEANAEAAAKLALAEAQPLDMNGYKIDIARILVKRSILGLPDRK